MVNDILTSAGYVFKGKCRCSGVLKETWKKGIETIIIYPTQKKFRGKTGKKPLTELASYLA